MKLFPDTKIYVLCPGNFHSGGLEVGHQLCSKLLNFGLDACMLYTAPDTGFNPEDPVDDFYKKYHLPYVVGNWEDKPHNIFIINEGSPHLFYWFKNARKIFWWLSVDNYFGRLNMINSYNLQNFATQPVLKYFYFNDIDATTEHWVQSEYARQFVKRNGIPGTKTFMVADYLNHVFLTDAVKIDLSRKKNFVAFNPKKGFQVTQKLIELAPDIEWKPIQNMTPEQVRQLLIDSKIYIDFGNHPGKDRIPREAAMSGCVVITGKRGAAANEIDINIPAEFKFDESEEVLPKVIEKIRSTFENFNSEYEKQKGYRETIADDQNRFEREIAAAFKLKIDRQINSVAAVQGFGEKSFSLVTSLLQNKKSGLVPKFIVDDEMCKPQVEPIQFLTRIKNTNYFHANDSGRAIFIPVISSDDARFLYLEGRIKKFALLSPNEEEIAKRFEKIIPEPEDVLTFGLT